MVRSRYARGAVAFELNHVCLLFMYDQFLVWVTVSPLNM